MGKKKEQMKDELIVVLQKLFDDPIEIVGEVIPAPMLLEYKENLQNIRKFYNANLSDAPGTRRPLEYSDISEYFILDLCNDPLILDYFREKVKLSSGLFPEAKIYARIKILNRTLDYFECVRLEVEDKSSCIIFGEELTSQNQKYELHPMTPPPNMCNLKEDERVPQTQKHNRSKSSEPDYGFEDFKKDVERSLQRTACNKCNNKKENYIPDYFNFLNKLFDDLFK